METPVVCGENVTGANMAQRKRDKTISATDESGFLQENAEITENEEGIQPGYLDRGFLPQIAQMDADGKDIKSISDFRGASLFLELYRVSR